MNYIVFMVNNMKKIFKSRIFSFILGAVIFSGISVCAYSLSSNDISFTPENNNWQVSNVEEAVNDLYDKSNLGDLEIIMSKGNVANGTTITTEVGSYIFVSSPATTYATNAEIIIGTLYGGSFNNVGTYTCVFRATGTSVTITSDNNVNFSYIIAK